MRDERTCLPAVKQQRAGSRRGPLRGRRALAAHIERGELETALEAFSPTDVWLHVAYMQRRHNSAALMALLAHLESEMHRAESVFSLSQRLQAPPAPGADCARQNELQAPSNKRRQLYKT